MKKPSLRRLALTGVVSTAVITAASGARGWPFPSLTAEPWLFQFNTVATWQRYSFLVVFFAGVAGLCWSWVRLLAVSGHEGVTWKNVAAVAGAWSLPLLFSVPLFSGDVYVYWVDGQQLARGFNPYETGVSSMGAAPMVVMVHSLWRATTTMYGPIFIRIAQGVTELSADNVIAGVMLFRAIAIASVVAMGASVIAIAKHIGHSPARALAFAVANPIVLMHLISGAHNDAAMIGILISGLALGVTSKSPLVRGCGLALCAVAALFKIPALAGVAILGWMWAGSHVSLIRRAYVATLSSIAGLGVFAALTLATGLGFGWVKATDVPGLAHPLLAPANAFGIGFGSLVGMADEFNTVTRLLALAASLGLATLLILRAGRAGSHARVLRAFGWGLLAIAWLGPAVYPWYMVWGIALVAAVGAGRLHKHLIVVTVLVSFSIAPGGYGMLDLINGWAHVVIALLASIAFAYGAFTAVRAVYPNVSLSKATGRSRKWESLAQSSSV